MADDDRTYIRLHDGMPEHWKVEDLSDSAFRRLITLWCWCSRQRTDGRLPERKWLRSGSDSDRTELLDAGLVEPARDGNGVVMHDYLKHQRSRDDQRRRSEAARKANHVRHHVKAGKFDPTCELCVLGPPSDSDSGSDPNRVHERTPLDSQSRSDQRRADKRREDQVWSSARTNEARRWLAERYNLTGPETDAVLSEVRRRALTPITSPIRYLGGMAEGDLADIVKAVMDATEAESPPALKAVPDLPTRIALPDPVPVDAISSEAAIAELRAKHGWTKNRAAP